MSRDEQAAATRRDGLPLVPCTCGLRRFYPARCLCAFRAGVAHLGWKR